jgi:phosphoadenosine phosphosulfate reductase
MLEETLQVWNAALAEKSPQEILEWAVEQFAPKLVHACSFGGASGMAILDMLVKIAPETPIFYLDTGFLFPETLTTRDAAMRAYGITPLAFRPKQTPEEQAIEHGEALWKRDKDLCCALRKIEPSQRALKNQDAWLVGLRRDQAKTREAIRPVQWDAQFNLYKIAPLANWTERDVWDYLVKNNVPYNPLHDHGYPSIGCTHCTRAVGANEDLRAGRWSDSEKTECGLHQ